MSLETDCRMTISGKVQEVEGFLELFPQEAELFPLTRLISGNDQNGRCFTQLTKFEKSLSQNGTILTAMIEFISREIVPDNLIISAAVLHKIPSLKLDYQPDMAGGCGEIIIANGKVLKNEWFDYSSQS